MMMTLIACNKTQENPLLTEQNTPYGVPAFDKIKLEHYRPAFDAAIEKATKEVDAITSSEEAPTFQNTIAALDRSGRQLQNLGFLLQVNNLTDEPFRRFSGVEDRPNEFTEYGRTYLFGVNYRF